jgi:hypothetical protein
MLRRQPAPENEKTRQLFGLPDLSMRRVKRSSHATFMQSFVGCTVAIEVSRLCSWERRVQGISDLASSGLSYEVTSLPFIKEPKVALALMFAA